MNQIEPISEVSALESPKKSGRLRSAGVIGIGALCGVALISTIMPTCSCAGRTIRAEAEHRRAAIEEAIRQQSGSIPAPGHARVADVNE